MYLFVSNENILHYSMFKAVIYWEFDFFFDVFDSLHTRFTSLHTYYGRERNIDTATTNHSISMFKKVWKN